MVCHLFGTVPIIFQAMPLGMNSQHCKMSVSKNALNVFIFNNALKCTLFLTQSHFFWRLPQMTCALRRVWISLKPYIVSIYHKQTSVFKFRLYALGVLTCFQLSTLSSTLSESIFSICRNVSRFEIWVLKLTRFWESIAGFVTSYCMPDTFINAVMELENINFSNFEHVFQRYVFRNNMLYCVFLRRCLYSDFMVQLKLSGHSYVFTAISLLNWLICTFRCFQVNAFEVACAISTLLSRERWFHELRKEVRRNTEKRRVSPVPFRSAPAKCSPKKETAAYINHGLVRAVYISFQQKCNSHIAWNVSVT